MHAQSDRQANGHTTNTHTHKQITTEMDSRRCSAGVNAVPGTRTVVPGFADAGRWSIPQDAAGTVAAGVTSLTDADVPGEPLAEMPVATTGSLVLRAPLLPDKCRSIPAPWLELPGYSSI